MLAARKLLILLLVALASFQYYMATAVAEAASVTKTIYPAVSSDKFIVYNSPVYGVSKIVPNQFTAYFDGQADAELKDYYDLRPDWDTYKLKVVKLEYTVYPKSLGGPVRCCGGKLLSTYLVSVNVIPEAVRKWIFLKVAVIAKAYVSVQAYYLWEKPPTYIPNRPLTLASLAGINTITVKVHAVIERTYTHEQYDFYATFHLDLNKPNEYLMGLVLKGVRVDVKGYRFLKESKLLTPVGDVYLDLCLRGAPGYTFTGEVRLTDVYNSDKNPATVTLTSGSCTTATIRGAVLTPGVYDEKHGYFTVDFLSGALYAELGARARISGIQVLFGRPLLYLEKNGSTTYRGFVDIPVSVNRYGYYEAHVTDLWVGLSAHGKMFRMYCNPDTFTVRESGDLKCRVELVSGAQPQYFSGATAVLHARLDVNGEDAGNLDLVTGVFIAGSVSSMTLVASLYNMVISGLMVIGFSLIGIGSVFRIIAPRVTELGTRMLAMGFIMVMTAGIVHALVLALAYISYIIVSYTPLGKLISLPLYVLKPSDPGRTLAYLVGFYDDFFATANEKYATMVHQKVESYATLHILAYSAFIVAAILAATRMVGFVSGVFSVLETLGAVLLPMVASVLAMFSMLEVSVAVVTTVLALVKDLVFLVLILSVSILPLAVLLMATGRWGLIGEQLLAASLLVIIVIPLTGLIADGLYNYTIMESEKRINEIMSGAKGLDIKVAGWAIELVMPYKEILYISTYIIATGAALGIIAGALASILLRTGMFSGLASWISRMATPR